MRKRSISALKTVLALLLVLALLSCCTSPAVSGVQPASAAASSTVYAASSAEPVQHAPYVSGSGGFFRPDQAVTRAELAQMLCNLNLSSPGTAQFSDVADDQWFAPAVAQLSGVLTGYEDGTFRPFRTASLGEFLAILCRIFEAEPAGDASAAWYTPYLDAALELQWIDEAMLQQGDAPTSRATAVTILNRALSRIPDQAVIDGLEQALFVDVQPGHPAYYDILEAAVSHACNAGEDGWLPDSVDFTPLEPGLYVGDGSAYYVQESHTLYRTPGLLSLDGNDYLVADETGRIYADSQLHLLDGSPVVSTSTGALLRNGSWNGFQFDSTGRYTSGFSDIDAYVSAILAQCTTSSMTQLEKLRAAYDYVRSYGYLGRNSAVSDQVMSPAQAAAYAAKIYETGKGDCYNFAAAFYFLARALGYDATAIFGNCLYSWRAQPLTHSWLEIPIDGTVYVFDPQLESYNLRSGISNETHSAFQVTYETAPAVYYKN